MAQKTPHAFYYIFPNILGHIGNVKQLCEETIGTLRYDLFSHLNDDKKGYHYHLILHNTLQLQTPDETEFYKAVRKLEPPPPKPPQPFTLLAILLDHESAKNQFHDLFKRDDFYIESLY